MNEIIMRIEEMVGNGVLFFGNGTVLIVTIIIGLILGLFGLKLVRVWAAFIGFLMGVGIGGVISNVAGLTGVVSVCVMVGCAVVLAALTGYFYKVGIFCFTIFMVTGVCMMITNAQSLPFVLISLALGAVTAVFTIFVFDPLVIIVTSISGGFMAGNSIVALLGLDDNILVLIVIPLVLAAICILVQFVMKGRQIGKKQVKQADEHRQKVSRESEVEEARKLLDDDDDDFAYADYDDEEYEDVSPEDLEEASAPEAEETDLEEDEDFKFVE